MKTLTLAIVWLTFSVAPLWAQSTLGGLSYRFVNGSGSWGLSMDIERSVGSVLLGGQFSYISYATPGEQSSSGTQIGIAVVALSTGKWIRLGPELGLAFGAGTQGSPYQSVTALNYGVMLKLAFAAIPESALLSIDYAAQTKLGIGLTFPLN
jgi:hypothetical protein